MSKSQWAGWILSFLLAAFLIFASASGKFTEWEGKEAMFNKFGFESDLMYKIGVVEVLIAAMFLVPRLGFIAAILITAYLGGAVATHVRVGDIFIFPIIIGVVCWIALGLRDPRVFRLAFTNSSPVSNDSQSP